MQNKERFVGGYLLFVFMCLVITAIPRSASAQSEGYKFYSLTVSSGDDPISSGITGIVQFANERDRLVEVAVQHEQAWIIYGQKFKTKSLSGFIGASIGHFQGAPWTGPFLTLNMPIVKIAGQQFTARTMQWPGVFAWEPRDWKNDGVPNPESVPGVVLASFGLDIGPVGLTYSKLNFLEEPWNTLPGVSYTKEIQKDFSVTGSATWNSNKEKWLFYVGLTWNPER